MNRFIIAIAIAIPLVTVFFVTMNSKKDQAEANESRKRVEAEVVEPEKHFSVEITAENFDELVTQSDKPVVLDFWAPWCGPCMMLGPHVEDIAEEYEGLAIVGKINTDENKELGIKFQAASIPLVLVLKDGEVVKKFEGFDPKTPNAIRKAVDKLLRP